MEREAAPVRWASKVAPEKIRRLYEADAAGLGDEELLDEVGCGLYVRCVSILEVTEAALGRAKCHGCGGIIRHRAGRDEGLRCEGGGWGASWRGCQRGYKGKQLFGGAALGAFRQFVEKYPTARTYAERMLLVDRLIHEFHWNLVRGSGEPRATRPAAANLIDCPGLRAVEAFLDELSGHGSRPAPETAPDGRQRN
jgi:hypothetical protein